MNAESKAPPFPRRIGTAYAAARGVAAGAGVFSLAVCALIAANFFQSRGAAPTESPALEQLQARLAARPGDESLKEDIRALDLLARKAYFTGSTFAAAGAVLLLAGLAVFLGALKAMGRLHPRLPRPGKASGIEEPGPSGRLALWAVGAVGAALAAVSLVLLGLTPSAPAVPPPRGGPTGVSGPGLAASPFSPPASLPPPPARAEVLRNWPSFRGPDGVGVAHEADPPVAWDGASGANVAWKIEVPRPGFSSPVVWGNRVFLTGGDRKIREVFCFDADTGAMLWRREAAGIRETPPDPPEVSDDTGYAAPSPATDGRLVFAVFATGDAIALDLEGRPAWGRNLGVPDNPYGHAASPMAWGDLVLVPFDDARGGRLIALEARTGKTAWQTPRPVQPSWSSLIVVNTGSRWEAILDANPFTASYDPATGKELWRAECLTGEVAPTPAFADGKVFAANANACLAAIDAATARIVWEHGEDLPDVSSPVAGGGLVFMPDGGGRVTCLNAASGKVLWTHDFPDGFYGSPVLAGGRVYVTDRKGVTRIFAAADAFRPLGDCALGEPSVCTPAIQGDRLFLRGDRHMFCIGKKGK